MARRLSVAKTLELLTAKGFSGGEISFQNQVIGRYVTHGDRNRNTVYASRIYSPVKIEVTGRTKSSMLGKVAKKMVEAFREGSWPEPEIVD